MRPIKFRAWHTLNKEMVVFDINKVCEDNYQQQHLCNLMRGDHGDVLMQFTGLTDKNGVDIYEDDIIKTYHFTDKVTRKDEYLYHVVTWSERFHGWFMLSCSSMDENDGSIQLFVHLRANKSIEVHSNIYQSPELMESKS